MYQVYPENPEGTRVIVGSMNIGYDIQSVPLKCMASRPMLWYAGLCTTTALVYKGMFSGAGYILKSIISRKQTPI